MAEELEDAPWATPKETAQSPDLPDAPWVGGEQQKPALSWSEVPGKALTNVGPSALAFGKSVVQPIGDVAELGARGIDWAAQKLGAKPRQPQPMETAESFAKVGAGILEKAGLKESAGNEQYADAVGRFFADRYGGIENIKRTLAEDPVGIAADFSTLLTAGGGLAARAPGLVGKIGRATSATGSMVDPISAVTRPAAAAARGIGRTTAEALGLTTHVGSEPFIQAARAGYEGGQAAKAFRENIRGIAPTEEAVVDAQNALGQLRKQRGELYREGMVSVARDQTVLNFNKIDDALTDITRVGTFHGQITQPKTQAIRQELGSTIAEWRVLDPATFHTAEGLDALKQKIGDIRDATQYGTPDRKIANDVYHAVRQTIIKQAPEYAKVMKGYEEASSQLKNLQRELSIPNPDRGNIDTSLRKLQSTLRNNVNTSFARRRELAQYLIDAGSPDLMYKLAGQSLQPWMPRGLGRAVAAAGLEALGIAGAAGVSFGHAPMIPLAGLMSPRLMGEAAYWGGTAARPLKYLPESRLGLPSYQIGRIPTIQGREGFKHGGRVTKTFRISK